MAKAKQRDQWAHTAALIVSIGNIFAKNPVSIGLFLPEHLRGAPRQEKEPTPEEAKAGWRILRAAIERGTGGNA